MSQLVIGLSVTVGLGLPWYVSVAFVLAWLGDVWVMTDGFGDA